MRNAASKISGIVFGRVARNVYFWIALVAINLTNRDYEYAYPVGVYYRYSAYVVLFLAAFTYTNNLWLIPRFLVNKRFAIYFSLAALLLVVASVSFVVMMKDMITRYPDMEIYQVSILTPVIDYTWSVSRVLSESIWAGIGLLMWGGVMTMAWYMNDYFRKEKETSLYKRKHVEAELNYLKSQLNPHFLFNTLNNLYGLVLERSEKAPGIVVKLSSILRYMLSDAQADYASSEREKEVMQAYIDLELLRLLGRDGTLNFNIDTDAEYQMPTLIWMPILENVFKHGTRYITSQLFIDYRFAIRNGVLYMRTENCFKVNAGKPNEPHGFGLANLRKRLNMSFPRRHKLKTWQRDDRFFVELEIKLHDAPPA